MSDGIDLLMDVLCGFGILELLLDALEVQLAPQKPEEDEPEKCDSDKHGEGDAVRDPDGWVNRPICQSGEV